MQKIKMVRLRGIEPPLPAPEAGALSTELQAQSRFLKSINIISKTRNNATATQNVFVFP